MSDAVIKRLEAVAAKLEAFAASAGASAPAFAPASSSAPAASGPSARLRAFDAWIAQSVQPFLDAANAVEGTKVVAKNTSSGLQLVRSVVAATDSCKKPSDAELAKFLAPLGQIVESGSNPDNRSEVFNQLKSFAEGQPGLLLWPQISPATAGTTPKAFVQDMLEAADFYLNKVLIDGKKNGSESVTKFATTFKSMMQALQQFIVAHFAAGLEWNPKGGELASFSGASSASSSAVPQAPDAPPAPPAAPAAPGAPGAPGSFAPAKPTTSGMGAVFGELTGKGDSVTSGLRKVTADMKSKNRTNEPVLEAKAPAAAAPKPKAAATAAAKKPPQTYLSKGTWFVEHHDGAHDIVLSDVQLKENVYILKCTNSTITIPNKCKSVQVDNCSRSRVVFSSIVSVFEVFNSQRVTLECQQHVPSIAVDKSAGVSIELSRAAMETPPGIITSSITELNVVVPGATDEDDPVEIPMPEQYETRILPGNKLHTEAVSHSGN